MNKKEKIAIEHEKFRNKYRATTSGDWQTFQLGLEAGWKAKEEFDKEKTKSEK